MSNENHQTRLDQEMTKAGHSSTWLAAQLECSVSTVDNYRNGTTIPRADVALKMANIYGLTVEEIIQKFAPVVAAVTA